MAVIHIKNREPVYINIISVISYYANKDMINGIKDTRSRDIQAQCPSRDHQDNNPSWGINRFTGVHHCYGCEFRGDIFALIMELENCKFDRAIEIGLRISSSEIADGPINNENISYAKLSRERDFRYYPDSILDVMEVKYDYLLERGVSEDICKKWEIRYNESRYVIPVRDLDKQLIGFIGVADDELRAQGKKKYLNSPQLWVSKLLLGMHKYDEYECSDKVILVEGPIDTLRVASLVGDKIGVMGLLHSHLSQGQHEVLQKLDYDEIYLMADNDSDESKAGDKLRRAFMKSDLDVVDIQYSASDPGEIQEEEMGTIMDEVIGIGSEKP